MSDLDSFFAKKDKKKVKGRKFNNADDIAKRMQESEKRLEDLYKVEPLKKNLDEPFTNSLDKPKETAKKDEEEWNEYKDESQKDLTDLKISNLQIEDDDDHMGGYGSGEDGESGNGRNNGGEGVWSRNIPKTEDTEEEEQTVAVPVSKDSNTKSKYQSPHLRNQSMAPLKSSRKPRIAPDITNAAAFPSLSDTRSGPPSGPWGRRRIGEDRGFENVKHGSTKAYSNDYAPAKLSTANRFDALSDS